MTRVQRRNQERGREGEEEEYGASDSGEAASSPRHDFDDHDACQTDD